jgi:hypothetical protein
MSSIKSRVLTDVESNGNMRDMMILDRFRPP